MATGLPVLERVRTDQSELKAYGKLSGGVEAAEMTEEQKAFDFNSRISSNYQKLINPEYSRAEDYSEAAEPEYATPAERAQATLYPERYQAAQAGHQRVTEDLFRADSPINAQFTQELYAQPAFEETQQAFDQAYAGEATAQATAEEADLMPTATTIQYRNELYRDEQRTAVEEKRAHGLTAKGKLLMAVYAVVVVIIMALIIVNTSVLKRAGNEIAAQEARLSEVAAQSQALQDEIDHLTDPDTIIERAAELGMTRSA